MPNFPDLSSYAVDIAPVIDAVHVDVHAAARPAGRVYFRDAGLEPGLLIDQRFTLPLRPLTRAGLAAVYRYGEAGEREAEIRAQLAQGTLREDPDGTLPATARALEFIEGLYDLHDAASRQLWGGHAELVPVLAELVGRVLAAALREAGEALAVMAPPYERAGSQAGVVLFNRLAALRYHRADSHAAAWRAAGLTAEQVVALGAGPRRRGIEDDTNRRAAGPYTSLTEREREVLLGGLLRLTLG